MSQSTKSFIKALYDAGYNHVEIANRLYRDRKIFGTETSETECLKDVEDCLLEMHKRKVKA